MRSNIRPNRYSKFLRGLLGGKFTAEVRARMDCCGEVRPKTMYFADIFNSMGLFQNLGGWIGTLDGTGTKARSQIVLQRAHQVLFHLGQCDHLERLAREQFDLHVRSIADLPDCIQAWSPHVANLIIELSATLGTLRILQNEVWMLAASASGVKDAPASMRKAFKAISQKNGLGSKRQTLSTKVPADIRNAVAMYWTNSGEAIATYRDIDQHHDVLARGCFLLMGSNAIRRARIPPKTETVVDDGV